MNAIHQLLISRELGGAGLIALHLSRYLRDQGQDCDVWLRDEGPAWNEAAKLGLRCNKFDAARALGANIVAASIANWRLERRLGCNRPGIAHVHSPVLYGALRWGLKLSGLARVVHVQIEEDVESLAWAARTPPELIITCASYLVDLVQRALPDKARGRTRVVAVPNAVDTIRFAPAPKVEAKQRVGARLDWPLVLMLANLAPHKGQETAIRAVALLKQRGIDVTCWLAGTEREGKSYTTRLRALIGDCGVADRVVLLGQRSDAPKLLQAADFFLLPSTREGLPLSLLEAQATGVSVLAAPTAGVPEIVQDGETGFLLPADDAEGYARRIEQLLLNPELGQRIGDAALTQTRRDHNWTVYCRRIVDLYDELLETCCPRKGRWRFLGRFAAPTRPTEIVRNHRDLIKP